MYDFKMNCTLVSCPIVFFILSEVILNFQVKTLICTSQWKKKTAKCIIYGSHTRLVSLLKFLFQRE